LRDGIPLPENERFTQSRKFLSVQNGNYKPYLIQMQKQLLTSEFSGDMEIMQLKNLIN